MWVVAAVTEKEYRFVMRLCRQVSLKNVLFVRPDFEDIQKIDGNEIIRKMTGFSIGRNCFKFNLNGNGVRE